MPDPLTGADRVADVLLYVASVVGAVTVVAGAVGWLVWPRVKAWAHDLVESALAPVHEQLTSDAPDTVNRYAKVAAAATAELPAIRGQLDELAEGLREVDAWRRAWEVRLGSIEQIVLALLGPELRRRIADLNPTTTPTGPDPDREDC